MRLDFTNFQISGPSTLTLSIGKNIGGQVGSPTGVLVSQKTTCATDSFSISNAPGVPVSNITFLNLESQFIDFLFYRSYVEL